MQAELIWNDIEKIRSASPLVHNITNYVVMNNTANALLALGASPVMAHSVEEVEDMTAIASALVINIGTLSPEWVAAMKLAMTAAAKRGLPIVFDPVGAGATPYRSKVCYELLGNQAPTIIRGNASEIMALVDANVKTKGVDSLEECDNRAEAAAQLLSREYAATVVVSGGVDLVIRDEAKAQVANGHPLMPRVTGLGCTASALVGAFAAVNADPFAAAAHAMAVMGICGELAAEKADGPGTLQLYFIDALYNLTSRQVKDYLRIGLS